MANYLGLVILFGITKLPRLKWYFSKTSLFHCPAVTKCMTFERFKAISVFFHVTDESAIPGDNDDKLIKVRPLLNYFRKKFKDVYAPNKNMTIDEGIMNYKGILKFKHHLHDQHDNSGIKFYFLAESKSGYVYNFDVYTENDKTTLENINTLTEPIRHKGYHVYTDNHHNSIEICEDLLIKNIHSRGMLKILKGVPKILKEEFKSIRINRTRFRRKGYVFVIGWKDNSLVKMISSCHNADTEEFKKKRKFRKKKDQNMIRLINKPLALCDYKKNKKGADNFEQMLKYHYFAKKRIKWTKKMSFYLIQMAIFNSFSLYKQYYTGSKNLLHLFGFLEMLCKELLNFQENKWLFTGCNDLCLYNEENLLASLYVNLNFSLNNFETVSKDYPKDYDTEMRYDRSYRHDQARMPRRKIRKCCLCLKSNVRKWTRFHCETCQVPLCQGRCHTDYHNRQPNVLK